MTSHTYIFGGALPPILESWGGSSPSSPPSAATGYYIATSLITEATSIKYLGVQIDNKLTWNDHIQYITHKAA